MPADKPVGNFSSTRNVASYPQASALITAAEYSVSAVGVSLPNDWAWELGSVLTDGFRQAGTAEAAPDHHIIGTNGGRHDFVTPMAGGPLEMEIIWRRRSAAGPGSFGLLLDPGGGFDYWRIEPDGATISIKEFNARQAITTTPAVIGDIYHIFISTDGATSTSLTVYKNAVSLGTVTAGAGTDLSVCGEVNPETNWQWISRRYYSRALTPAERDQHALGASREEYAVVGAVLSAGTAFSDTATSDAGATDDTSAIAAPLALTSTSDAGATADTSAIAAPLAITVTSDAGATDDAATLALGTGTAFSDTATSDAGATDDAAAIGLGFGVAATSDAGATSDTSTVAAPLALTAPSDAGVTDDAAAIGLGFGVAATSDAGATDDTSILSLLSANDFADTATSTAGATDDAAALTSTLGFETESADGGTADTSFLASPIALLAESAAQNTSDFAELTLGGDEETIARRAFTSARRSRRKVVYRPETAPAITLEELDGIEDEVLAAILSW